MSRDFNHISAGFPILGSENPNISAAAERFVAAKADMDYLIESRIGRTMITRAIGEDLGYHSIDPFTYAYNMLPFFQFHRTSTVSGKKQKAMVPARITIGDSWKWKPKYKSAEEQNEIIKKAFDSFQQSTDDRTAWECASYVYIPKLGVALAHEGKNRVALFRERGMDIPAVVHEEDYPDADRIRMFNLPEGDFAVLDNRYVEQIRSLELTSEILVPFGVITERQWPENFPEISRVKEELASRGRRYVIDDMALDMVPVLQRQNADETVVRASLCDIDSPLRPTFHFFMSAFFIDLMLMVLVPAVQTWPILEAILCTLLAVANAVIVLVTLPIFECKLNKLTINRQHDLRHQILSTLREKNENNTARAY